MELKKVESLKIEITKRAELTGSIYYRLVVNDQYITLSSKLEEMEEQAKQIETMFRAGEMDEKIIYTKELKRQWPQ